MHAIRLGTVTAVIAGVLFVVSGSLMAEEEQEVPEEILIQNEGYKSDKKGLVPFSHMDHAESYEVACSECHHVYEDGKNVWKEGDPVAKCSECHDPLKSEGKVKKLQLAFHRNCKNCHKDMAKQGLAEDAPYRKCNDCHEKGS